MSKTESDSSKKSDKIHSDRYSITVDQLFPSDKNVSGSRGRRFDVNSLFDGLPNQTEVQISMSHKILLEREKRRYDELHNQYMFAYKNCWDKIDSADNDGLKETIFEVLPNLPRYPKYSPQECLEIIQDKLRTEEFMDTLILEDGLSIYIDWSNIKRNKEAYGPGEDEKSTHSDDHHHSSEKKTETERDEDDELAKLRDILK